MPHIKYTSRIGLSKLCWKKIAATYREKTFANKHESTRVRWERILAEDFSFFIVAFCRCLRTAIDGWNSERASASESELIGQVENDQRARRVIDRTRATRGEWTDAPVRRLRTESTQGRQLNQHNIWSAFNLQVASWMTWGAEKAFAESCVRV